MQQATRQDGTTYAHRRNAQFHWSAAERVCELAEGRAVWAIPWPCFHEFYSAVTHPRVHDPPSTTTEAIDQIDAWCESSTLTLLRETGYHWSVLRALLQGGQAAGTRVHDAWVAALCISHGVRELWSVDRDFDRFPELGLRNPLR